MTFYDPGSEITWHHSCGVLLVEADMSPPTFKGRVHRPHLSVGGMSKSHSKNSMYDER